MKGLLQTGPCQKGPLQKGPLQKGLGMTAPSRSTQTKSIPSTSLLSIHARKSRYGRLRGLAMGFGIVTLATACDPGFTATSLYPRRVWDYAERQVLVYGTGFEEGVTASVSYTNQSGNASSAPLNNLQVLDSYTLVGNVPYLEDQIQPEVFPYQEFVAYSSYVTPGLYDCSTGEPALWTPGGGNYCDASLNALTYSPYNPAKNVVPPAVGESPRLYANWYDLLATCLSNPETTVSEEQLALLIPDYGLGCYSSSAEGRSTQFQYCPLYIPNQEVDVLVEQAGESRLISKALSVRNFQLDYYNNPDYGTRVQGAFGAVQETPMGEVEGMRPIIAMGSAVLFDGNPYLVVATANTVNKTITLTTDPIYGTGVAVDIELESAPSDIAFGDLNQDGLPDLLVSSQEGAEAYTIYTALSEDETTLLADQVVSLSVSGIVPTTGGIMDVSQDGLPDVVLVGESTTGTTGKVAVLLQDIDTNLSAPNLYTIEPAPRTLVFGELSGTAGVELVIANGEDNNLSILRNSGNGTFIVQTFQTETTGVGLQIVAPLVLDEASVGYRPTLLSIDDDDLPDLVILNQQGTSRRALAWSGNGQGGFNPPARETVLNNAPELALLLDANNDGALDLVASDPSGILHTYENAGGDLFKATLDLPGPTDVTALLSEDVDFDGDLDVLTFSPASGVLTLMNNPSTLNEYFDVTLLGCAY